MPNIHLGELQKARKAMRKVGATGPEMARPARDLPDEIRSELGRYVDAGFVREGPAGTFYLHEARASTIMRGLIVKTVVFWFLVIIVPVIILQISNSRPAP
jgi:hypothetical protein